MVKAGINASTDIGFINPFHFHKEVKAQTVSIIND